MQRGQRRTRFLVLVATSMLLGAATVPAFAVVKPPPGAARPTPGSGIGTKAALENPRCRTGEEYGPYGRFDSTTVGGGPVCVRPWRGGDNGGATAPGVTKDTVRVVAVVPNEQQITSGGGTMPVNRADNSPSTYEDAVHDYLRAVVGFYETWGRDIEIHVLTSSGNDEAAQRADAVAVRGVKPFAVVNFVPAGTDFLDAELAKAKILVFGYSTTTKKALAQAPYRWGLADAQASAVNAAVVIGKQLAGKKAAFAGNDDITKQTRVFGTVYIDGGIDLPTLEQDLKRYDVTLATEASYQGPGSPRGDVTSAQEQAPVIVTRMKAAGVTSVILFTDMNMTKALMENATRQEWYPEWFFTGTLYHDLAFLAREYPPEQSAHAFGISILSPWVQPDPPPPPPQKSLTVLTNALNWYWGEGVGHTASAVPGHLNWLLTGVHTAGPKLTAKTFQRGLFSLPASGGAAQGYPTGMMSGYGRTSGLPYDSYLSSGLDFAAVWWDPDRDGPSQGTGLEGKGVAWYADGAKRYRARDVPKKQFGWYDRATSVFTFATRPTPAPEYAGDCEGCPSQGGPGQPGAPGTVFVVEARSGSGGAGNGR